MLYVHLPKLPSFSYLTQTGLTGPQAQAHHLAGLTKHNLRRACIHAPYIGAWGKKEWGREFRKSEALKLQGVRGTENPRLLRGCSLFHRTLVMSCARAPMSCSYKQTRASSRVLLLPCGGYFRHFESLNWVWAPREGYQKELDRSLSQSEAVSVTVKWVLIERSRLAENSIKVGVDPPTLSLCMRT